MHLILWDVCIAQLHPGERGSEVSWRVRQGCRGGGLDGGRWMAVQKGKENERRCVQCNVQGTTFQVPKQWIVRVDLLVQIIHCFDHCSVCDGQVHCSLCNLAGAVMQSAHKVLIVSVFEGCIIIGIIRDAQLDLDIYIVWDEAGSGHEGQLMQRNTLDAAVAAFFVCLSFEQRFHCSSWDILRFCSWNRVMRLLTSCRWSLWSQDSPLQPAALPYSACGSVGRVRLKQRWQRGRSICASAVVSTFPLRSSASWQSRAVPVPWAGGDMNLWAVELVSSSAGVESESSFTQRLHKYLCSRCYAASMNREKQTFPIGALHHHLQDVACKCTNEWARFNHIKWDVTVLTAGCWKLHDPIRVLCPSLTVLLSFWPPYTSKKG